MSFSGLSGLFSTNIFIYLGLYNSMQIFLVYLNTYVMGQRPL